MKNNHTKTDALARDSVKRLVSPLKCFCDGVNRIQNTLADGLAISAKTACYGLLYFVAWYASESVSSAAKPAIPKPPHVTFEGRDISLKFRHGLVVEVQDVTGILALKTAVNRPEFSANLPYILALFAPPSSEQGNDGTHRATAGDGNDYGKGLWIELKHIMPGIVLMWIGTLLVGFLVLYWDDLIWTFRTYVLRATTKLSHRCPKAARL